MEAHNRLDVYWQFGWMTRNEAYALLAAKMHILPSDCHIGMFDEAQCEQAIDLCKKGLGGPRRRDNARA